MPSRYVAALVVIAGSCCGAGAQAQGDAMDFNFWSSVEARNTPDEYRAYLTQYPNGRFAALARIRLQAAVADGQAKPAPTTAIEADPEAPHFSIVPPTGRLGQTYVVDCGTLPEGATSADVIVAVAAGSPSTDGSPPLTNPIIVNSQYTANCKFYNGTLPGFGPLPPGRWEFRWMTKLYNTQNRLENRYKVDLVVR